MLYTKFDKFINESKNTICGMISPLYMTYEYKLPIDVKNVVYGMVDSSFRSNRWFKIQGDMIFSDNSDAIRWYRIINSKLEERYPDGDIEIYRAVDNDEINEIKPGIIITTDRKFAEFQLDKYFKNGKILSSVVDGSDILKSPTSNCGEGIYAPVELSIDVEY